MGQQIELKRQLLLLSLLPLPHFFGILMWSGSQRILHCKLQSSLVPNQSFIFFFFVLNKTNCQLCEQELYLLGTSLKLSIISYNNCRSFKSARRGPHGVTKAQNCQYFLSWVYHFCVFITSGNNNWEYITTFQCLQVYLNLAFAYLTHCGILAFSPCTFSNSIFLI